MTEEIDSEEPKDETVVNKPKSAPIKKQSKLFTFELLQCNLSESLVTCVFRITNEGKDQQFKLLPMYSPAADNSGKQYKGYKVITSELSNVGNNGVRLVSKVPVSAKLMIDGVDTNAKSLALLELKFCTNCGWSNEEVQSCKVPLLDFR